jgi:hypothetical protein
VALQVKQLARVELKAADLGQARAVFSTFDVIDKDLDVTLPGAFKDGAEVPISSFGHTSHAQLGGRLPVGRGTIRTDGREAWADIAFFMTTAGGRETFETVKLLGDLGEWSYSYDPVDVEHGTYRGQRVRFLKALDVNEISPVLRGAGIGTRTVDAKDDLDPATLEQLRAIARQLDPGPDMAREYARFVRSQLREVA